MKRLNGFSLMEMMIVLTIVAIVAAASAPMVNKKMVRSSSEKSPWIFVNESESIAYNLDNPNGIQDRKTATIGARIAPNNEHPRLYINTSGDANPHIMFGRNNGNIFKLVAGGATNSIIISDNIPERLNRGVVIGPGATASNQTQVVIGSGAQSGHVRAVAIGNQSRVAGEESIAIGSGSSVTNAYSTAVGHNAVVTGGRTIALGCEAEATQESAIAIGASNSTTTSAQATGISAIAIGASSLAQNNTSIAIGNAVSAAANSAIAVGEGARADNVKGIAIGNGATTTAVSFSGAESGGGSSPIAIGTQANAAYNSSIAFGNEAVSANFAAIAIGYGAKANASSSIAIGRDTFVKKGDPVGKSVPDGGCDSIALGNGARVNGLRSVAIGYNTRADGDYSVAIGANASATSANTIVLGDANTNVLIPGRLIVDKTAVLGYAGGAWQSWSSVAVIRSNREGRMEILQRDGDGDWDAVFAGGRVDWSWADNVKSDRRLKNVGKEFTSGLDKLKKLEVFNYTFKDDKDKTPRVGVIAQDLQKIFPDAVFKGEDGFLRIRMEDMFYAVVNAVKELDARVSLLEQQQKKINELEKRLADLEKKVK